MEDLAHLFDSIFTTFGGHSSMSSSICIVFSVIFKIMSYAAKYCALTINTSSCDRAANIIESDSSEAV